MALRKFLHFEPTDGQPTEQDPTDEINLGKVTATGVSGVAFDANGQKIVNVATPTVGSDGVNKAYVDGLISGSSFFGNTFDTNMAQGNSETFGTVTGLPITPTNVFGVTVYERDAGIAQSGTGYTFQPYEIVPNGFRWRISVSNDDYWPGPGAVALRVKYIWS